MIFYYFKFRYESDGKITGQFYNGSLWSEFSVEKHCYTGRYCLYFPSRSNDYPFQFTAQNKKKLCSKHGIDSTEGRFPWCNSLKQLMDFVYDIDTSIYCTRLPKFDENCYSLPSEIINLIESNSSVVETTTDSKLNESTTDTSIEETEPVNKKDVFKELVLETDISIPIHVEIKPANPFNFKL